MTTNAYVSYPSKVQSINTLTGAITLVAGANVTLTTLGNAITIAGSPAGSTGQLQFNNSGAFAASGNLFWDQANFRLGIGTATPDANFSVKKIPGQGVPLTTWKALGGETLASVNADGSLTVSVGGTTDVIGVNGNINDLCGIRVINANDGNNASATLLLQNDVNELVFFYCSSTTYTGNNIAGPRSGAFYCNAINGMGFDIFGDNYRFAILESEVFRIMGQGVGIFNQNPAFPLDVGGGINTSDGYNIGGVPGFSGNGAFTNFEIIGGLIMSAS